MEEDPRSSKQLLLAILQKCREALPEVATLMKRLDKFSLQQQGTKIRKKDCLNPKFLVQLSQCGEQIKGILTKALDSQRLDKESLRNHYRQYMEVIFAIRKYHEEAHLAHDMHKNSTAMKESLLSELKAETIKRKELEKELEFLRKQLDERDNRIAELQANGEPKDSRINISQISQISKKVEAKYGQLYGGESRVGQIDEDEQTVESRRLRKVIVELQQKLQEREQQLEQKDQLLEDEQQAALEQRTQYQRTVEQQRAQILELQRKFEEFYTSTNTQTLKVEAFKEINPTGLIIGNSHPDNEELLRFLLIQASTIEQYLKESEAD